jgi:uncharacterized membrane protein
MIKVTLFTKPDCHLCDETKMLLQNLQDKYPHELLEVNIDGNRELQLAYGLEIPVVEIGPYRLKAPISEQELQMTLGAASDRIRHLESIDETGYQEKFQRGWTVTSADRFSYWLSNHYMTLFNLFVLTYLGLPILAPVFMAIGFTPPARLIYKAYGAVCHQFAFRSWFLFGEQAAYPRAAAGVGGLVPFGQATGLDEADLWGARNFVGNPQVGYKIALCERDVSIYGGILLFGLLFTLTGKRLKPLPWYLWILIGILPIGLDGFSQILSQPPLNEIPPFTLLVYRESTPFLRSLTGALFGITTAWFGYPMVEETMAETRRFMASKFARVKEKVVTET